ncbi:MAG: hypothetical protein ACOX0Y_03310 [Thiopseudomonas sp.]
MLEYLFNGEIRASRIAHYLYPAMVFAIAGTTFLILVVKNKLKKNQSVED